MGHWRYGASCHDNMCFVNYWEGILKVMSITPDIVPDIVAIHTVKMRHFLLWQVSCVMRPNYNHVKLGVYHEDVGIASPRIMLSRI